MRFRAVVMCVAACLLTPTLAAAQDQQPPAEFGKVVSAAKELWYHTNTKLAPQGWVARRPCLEGKVDCSRYFLCRNLKASFMTSLVPDDEARKAVKRGKRHNGSIVWLWSWTYETPADARLALESLDYFNAVGVYGSPYNNSHR